jgi:hypothetical protein
LVEVDQLRDRFEVSDRIEAAFLEQKWIAGDRRIARQQQRVAIGRSTGNELTADRGRCALLVFDDDRLLPDSREPIGKRPSETVHAAAGGIRNYDPDQTIGKVLGIRRKR